MPPNFTGPVGPVEVFFYLPEIILGNFCWPGAIGPLLASSPGCTYTFFEQLLFKLLVAATLTHPHQGLSQDLDSRVSKMCFGGDRVSWQSNAARSLRSLRERPPFAAGGLGPAQGPQKPEGLGALKCILWLFLALIFIILHIEMYVFSV